MVTIAYMIANPQAHTSILSGTEADDVTQLQENPSYQPVTVVSAGPLI